jgi:(p)ppGpp synthase/HD superfamily hydrolase
VFGRGVNLALLRKRNVVDIQFQDNDIILSAIKLAVQLHASQRRKASIIPGGTPYISHLMEVAGMVLANGGDDITCAAAWLHDAIEDQGIESADRIREISPDVLALVQECTEVGTGNGEKAPWRERKDAYLAHIHEASLPALLIVTADKLQNARELRRKCDREGYDEVVARFGGGIQGQAWFHRELVTALYGRLLTLPDDAPMHIGASALLEELRRLVKVIFV